MPAPSVRVSLAAGSGSARVGDAVTLCLRVESPELLHIDWPDVAGQIDPAAAFVSPGSTVSPGDIASIASRESGVSPVAPALQTTEGGWVYVHTFTVQPTRAGPLHVPPLTVRCTPVSAGEDAAFEVVTSAVTIPVASVLAAGDDPLRPRDVIGPLSPPAAAARWPWVIGVIAAGMAIAAVVVLWRRGRPALPIDPTTAALAELDRLSRELREDDHAFDAYAFHHRLAAAVRAFLDQRFSIPAPEMTTPELMRVVGRNGDFRLDNDRLCALLRACDRVKYAASSAQRDEAAAAVSAAREFVESAGAATDEAPDDPGHAIPVPAGGVS